MQVALKEQFDNVLQPHEAIFKDAIQRHNKKRKDLHNEMKKVDGEISHVSFRTDNVNNHVKKINKRIKEMQVKVDFFNKN